MVFSLGAGSRLTTESCPLCFLGQSVLFHRDTRREYVRCAQCALVFVPPRYYLSRAEEKSYYDLHQNTPQDLGYRHFLARMFNPLQQAIQPNSVGLDFGSGPGPTLSVMLQAAGHRVDIYDPFYAPDELVFKCCYDFITATEVVEHLQLPGGELDRLWQLLKPGGVLGIMTKMVIDHAAFERWHYKNDPTHIAFFSRETFFWLSEQWQAELVYYGTDVVLFIKDG